MGCWGYPSCHEADWCTDQSEVPGGPGWSRLIVQLLGGWMDVDVDDSSMLIIEDFTVDDGSYRLELETGEREDLLGTTCPNDLAALAGLSLRCIRLCPPTGASRAFWRSKSFRLSSI